MSTDEDNIAQNPLLSKILDEYHTDIIWELTSIAEDNIDGNSNIGQLCMSLGYLHC